MMMNVLRAMMNGASALSSHTPAEEPTEESIQSENPMDAPIDESGTTPTPHIEEDSPHGAQVAPQRPIPPNTSHVPVQRDGTSGDPGKRRGFFSFLTRKKPVNKGMQGHVQRPPMRRPGLANQSSMRPHPPQAFHHNPNHAIDPYARPHHQRPAARWTPGQPPLVGQSQPPRRVQPIYPMPRGSAPFTGHPVHRTPQGLPRRSPQHLPPRPKRQPGPHPWL